MDMGGDERKRTTRERWAVAFGWAAGALAGVLLGLASFQVLGDGVPMEPVTFVLFVAGAFGGMRIADRWGARAFAPLGIAAGLLLAASVGLGVAWLVR